MNLERPSDNPIWRAKVHARLHDPAEKALVLLRDPSGHEGGSARVLHAQLFPQGVDEAVKRSVQRADWWASAADRPQFPRNDSDGRFARWTQVDFSRQPVLVHPLDGRSYDLGTLDVDVEAIKAQSLAHTQALLDGVQGAEGYIDYRHAALMLWRFHPELDPSDSERVGELWRFLPADTRIPDHSIWDHLDLVSAFAAAFAGDRAGGCALMSLSIGPVQEFIAAARSASDLWAGSHLLSRLTWEAMKVICERLGPEAVLMPKLRGNPQVDLWLLHDCALPRKRFEALDGWSAASDSHPLFRAGLPNRFVALVPQSQTRELAGAIRDHVRHWVQARGKETVDRLLREADLPIGDDCHAYQQMRDQLDGFPEVHWSAVPYSDFVAVADEQRQTIKAEQRRLADAMAAFFPPEQSAAPGFLGNEVWRVLSGEVAVDNARFYTPNPGVLYPAIQELADRLQAAAKEARAFEASRQVGYRDSLTGEAEWLTHDPDQLQWSPGKRSRDGTLWTAVAKARPQWAKAGEHLAALPALKRLWPTLFCEELQKKLDRDFQRFNVSTHAMALATSLENLGQAPFNASDRLKEALRDCTRVALPPRLINKTLKGHPDGDLIARLPDWLDSQLDDEGEAPGWALREIRQLLGARPETYYALILMDGDRMGAWLSGDSQFAGRYIDNFHPQIKATLSNRFGNDESLQRYLQAHRAPSPARQMAITGALNDFSLTLVGEVVERRYHGRVLYAGGDDVMAMVPVAELLEVMTALRQVYSGHKDERLAAHGLRCANGFVQCRSRLYLTMGGKATASAGAVIAHHKAPLGRVMARLRAAEQRAKREGGRDAFSVEIVKRSGGAVTLTAPWRQGEDAQALDIADCLRELRDGLTGDAYHDGASRRSVYNAQAWLTDLPEPDQFADEVSWRQCLQSLLHQQFVRQKLEKAQEPVHSRRLTELCPVESAGKAVEFLTQFMSVAEFLARESRRPQQ